MIWNLALIIFAITTFLVWGYCWKHDLLLEGKYNKKSKPRAYIIHRVLLSVTLCIFAMTIVSLFLA